MDIQHTIIITIIFLVVFLRLVAFWLNFGQLKTIFAKPQISSYSIAGGGLSALGSGQKFIDFPSSGNHKKHSAPTCFSDLQKNHLESRSFSTSITSSIKWKSPIAETKTKVLQSSAYQNEAFNSGQISPNKFTDSKLSKQKWDLEQSNYQKNDSDALDGSLENSIIKIFQNTKITQPLLQGNNASTSLGDKGKFFLNKSNILTNGSTNNKNHKNFVDVPNVFEEKRLLISSNSYAATAPILESSNLSSNKPPNLPLYIYESEAFMHLWASGMIDTCGKDFDKNLKVLGIVSGRSYLCDFRLIFQDKNSKKLSEIAVDISCTYDIERTLEAKCNTIKAQYNKNYPAATHELRNYGTLNQPKQLYFIDLDHLQKTGHHKLVIYSVSQDGRVVDGPIAHAKFSTYLEEHSAIHHVPPSDLLILDKNKFAHTKLGEPVYGIDDFNSILLSNNSIGVLRHLITF